MIVSSETVFWDVTQRNDLLGGALRDIPKNGCGGDYFRDGLVRFQSSLV